MFGPFCFGTDPCSSLQPSHVTTPPHTVRSSFFFVLCHTTLLHHPPTVGRLRHFTSVTSPLTLFASSAHLVDSQKFLKEYQDGSTERGRNAWGHEDTAGIWKAKQRASFLLGLFGGVVLNFALFFSVVDSSIHPDTGLPVPLPFRLSAFVPTNLIIVGGMLMPNPTLKGVLFWQWANQSLNGKLHPFASF